MTMETKAPPRKVKLSDIKEGDILEVTSMDCIHHRHAKVEKDDFGEFYVICNYGCHYFRNQTDREGYLTGFKMPA